MSAFVFRRFVIVLTASFLWLQEPDALSTCKRVSALVVHSDDEYLTGLTPKERERTQLFLGLNRVGRIDTTSLRQEQKFVRFESDFHPLFSELEAAFGSRLKSRDKIAPGTKNQTRTVLSVPLRFKVRNPANGEIESRTAKLRVRGYETVMIEDGAVMRADITAQSKFVEFKIDYPNGAIPGVVTKHRALFQDKDVADLLHFDDLGRQPTEEAVQAIRARVKANNKSSDAELIDEIINAIRSLQNSPDDKGSFVDALQPYLEIAYVRRSYEIEVGPGVVVQITIDEGVRYMDPTNGSPIGSYPSTARVIEVKIPLKFAALDSAAMSEAPGLLYIKRFLERLNEIPRVEKYEDGAGKLANYRRGRYEPAEIVDE